MWPGASIRIGSDGDRGLHHLAIAIVPTEVMSLQVNGREERQDVDESRREALRTPPVHHARRKRRLRDGRVLNGALFHNGKVVICWRTGKKHGSTSVGVYDTWEALTFVHIDRHPTHEREIQ
jgi:hypothetical protein